MDKRSRFLYFCVFVDLKSIELHSDLKQLGDVNSTERHEVFSLFLSIDIPDVEGQKGHLNILCLLE